MNRPRYTDAALNALSNPELRDLLAEHGIKNQPVTQSTRSVLIKRLKQQMSQRPSTSGSSTRPSHQANANYLDRYSSCEEESDRETNSKAQRGAGMGRQLPSKQQPRPQSLSSGTRSTMPPPAARLKTSSPQQSQSRLNSSFNLFTPPSSSSIAYSHNHHSLNNSNSSANPSSNNHNLPTVRVPVQSRSNVYIPSPIQSSDTDESDAGERARTSKSKPSSMSYTRLSGFSFPKRYSPELTATFPPNVCAASIFDSGLRLRGTPPTTSAASTVNVNNSSAASSYNNSQSSRLSTDNMNSSSGAEDTTTAMSYDQDPAKRLLQYSKWVRKNHEKAVAPPTVPNSRYFARLTRSDIMHQAQENHSNRDGGSRSLRETLRLWFEQYVVKQTLVPCVLFGALILFITVIIIMYLTITPDLVNALQAKHTVFVACRTDDYDDDSTVRNSYAIKTSCIYEESVDAALNLLRLIAPELQRRIETHRCKDATVPFMVGAREALHMTLAANPQMHELEAAQNLHNMEYLIEMNPQWHIDHVNAGDGVPLSYDEVQQLRPSLGNAFAILRPRLPLSCLFYVKLQTFFLVVGTIGLTTVLSYVLYVVVRFAVARKRAHQELVNRMIRDIMQTVMDQAAQANGNAEASLIVVNHVRDKLIEPAKRKSSMERVWLEAIGYLERNESRIQFEVRTRNGEECKMIRWADTIQAQQQMNHLAQQKQQQAQMPAQNPLLQAQQQQPPPSSQQSSLYNSAQLAQMGAAMMNVKKWQSPAFDNANKVDTPPTQCLKIRHMFDKYEANNPALKQILTDAILEKVGPLCKVYDVQLEKQACCVYVRCASNKDAGIVHDEINGWWFDNRLVFIKFLRLERYLVRFPASTNNTHLLRPSNPNKLSLSQCGGSSDMNRCPDDEEEDDDDDEDDDDYEGDDYEEEGFEARQENLYNGSGVRHRL